MGWACAVHRPEVGSKSDMDGSDEVMGEGMGCEADRGARTMKTVNTVTGGARGGAFRAPVLESAPDLVITQITKVTYVTGDAV